MLPPCRLASCAASTSTTAGECAAACAIAAAAAQRCAATACHGRLHASNRSTVRAQAGNSPAGSEALRLLRVQRAAASRTARNACLCSLPMIQLLCASGAAATGSSLLRHARCDGLVRGGAACCCLHCTTLVADLPGHQHPAYKLSVGSGLVIAERGDTPKAVRAAKPLRAGERVHSFHAGFTALAEAASRWTLQLGKKEHVDLSHHVLRNINHSCHPNLRVHGLTLETLRHIVAGEELCLDYNCSEFELCSAFCCNCGEAGCVGQVRGWAHLSGAQRAARRGRCQEWLLQPGHD
jgi:hypothetical protein